VIKKSDLKFLLLITLSVSCPLFAQSYSKGEYGGVTDIFDFPVGARAMAMGGAYAAVANDPFALYWNPAALERVQQMSVGLYYTNLPAGTQYNFLSYVYPSLFFGTFSFGVLRLSTGGIDIYNAQEPIKLGSMDYGRTLFLFGYGIQSTKWLSIGTTFKLERAVFPGYPDGLSSTVGSIAESAFGADFGILFTPNWEMPLLRDFRLGINFQNALQRSLRAVQEREAPPVNVRFGISKEIQMTDLNSLLLLAFEADVNQKSFSKNSLQQVPPSYHFGMEYSYLHSALLRFGYDYRRTEAGQLGGFFTYGLGLKLIGFEADYSYWNGWDSILGSSHRISFILNVGKTRQQRLDELHEKEMKRIEEAIKRQSDERRQNAIISGYSQAMQYFNRGDFNRAFVAINKVLAFDQSGEDADLVDARSLLERINRALRKQGEDEFNSRMQLQQEEQRISRERQQIDTMHDRALAFFEQEEYQSAIEECDRALEIDPKSDRIINLRKTATEELTKKVDELLAEAAKLESQNNLLEAIRIYSNARRMVSGDRVKESLISGRISNLEGKLKKEGLIQQAAIHENNKNWIDAAALYKQALDYDPSNSTLKRKYEEAQTWANAKILDMSPEVETIYKKGYNALMKGKYDEAIEFYNEALKLQPQNITILNAIEYAKEKKRKLEGSTPGQ
jgi:tetratricopeptide (TPR) repeat protein